MNPFVQSFTGDEKTDQDTEDSLLCIKLHISDLNLTILLIVGNW